MKQDPAFWYIAFPVTLLLAAGSIWLYCNIDIRNADKKVVQAAVQWERMDFGHPCDEVPGGNRGI